MPAITIYTDPLKAGIAQMPTFTVGDDQNFSLLFNDGTNFYNPTGVTVKLGYIGGVPDGTYTSGFQWVDRLANQHIGSFAIASGVPGSLTWDENPIGVSGVDGAYLLLGRTPPSSQIRKVNVVYGGSAISTAPKLRFQGGTSETGQRATATATIGGGATITALTATNPGRGYSSTNPPEVIITGDGTGAVFKVTDTTGVVSGHVVSFTSVAAGSGYTTATVQIVDPEATATATVGGTSAVTAVTLLAGGMSYTSAPTVAITGGGGTLATATAALLNSTWGVSGLTITGAGTLYTTAPAVTFSGGTGTGVAATAEISQYGVVLSVTLTSPGNGRFDGVPRDVAFTGGGGSGATAKTIINANAAGYYDIIGIVMLTGGSGYTSTPTVVIDQGTGAGATGTAVVGTGAVISLTVTSPGSGYGATAPTVTIAAPGGGGVTATATAQLIGSPVGSLALTAGGSGYTSVPVLGFSGGAGTGAAGVATVALGITAVTMTQPGFAYTSQPAIALEGTTNGPILEAAGIETYSVPYLRNFMPLNIGSGVQAVPWTHNRRNSAGTLVYDDSLLLIQPQSLLTPTFTLQADGLTWAAVFTPVVRFVAAVLNFRSSVTVDFQVYGGGRVLLAAPLTIQLAQP